MKDADQLSADDFEKHTQVFIVRIWREQREIEGVATEWRGVIEHVPTHVRRYLKDLDVLAIFITPYLEAMGVQLTKSWWEHRWWNHRKRPPG